jgi:hypothetical protein
MSCSNAPQEPVAKNLQHLLCDLDDRRAIALKPTERAASQRKVAR